MTVVVAWLALLISLGAIGAALSVGRQHAAHRRWHTHTQFAERLRNAKTGSGQRVITVNHKPGKR